MQFFLLGWACSLGWGLVVVPILILKTAFRLPLSD